MEVLKNNPHIEKLLQHDESVKNENLEEHIQWLKRKNHCDSVIDLNESIEVSLSQHPRSPNYKLTKGERLARFNRNFYEYCFEHASIEPPDDPNGYRPELFFSPDELADTKTYLGNGFNILVGMSGSGNNKAWPYTEPLCELICKEYPDVHIITVGDLKCQLIEPVIEGRITNLSGLVPMRTSMALTGLVDLVIAPDTGIIHAAGCYDTPKICLLGHNTKECITKHFSNDYSIEADPSLSPCAPCLFLIYDMKLQCPVGEKYGASLCMENGIPLETVYNRFKEVYVKHQKGS